MPTPLDVISTEIKENSVFKPLQFIRKPFHVEAVQITEENILEVGAWCEGKVQTHPKTGNRFVKVKVYRPISARQTMAFIGDWVIQSATGFKVYPDYAFQKYFVANDGSEKS
jgi:hypothetical protein